MMPSNEPLLIKNGRYVTPSALVPIPASIHCSMYVVPSIRHPIQELCVDRFIANDTAMGGADRERLALVMGANYSGKSVYLKQARVRALDRPCPRPTMPLH